MMPDPNRQWFVYFKDKEMGPVNEADVQSKLKSGEYDSTAYVFTEGMSDWALVNETHVFSTGAGAAPAAEDSSGVMTEKLGTTAASATSSPSSPSSSTPEPSVVEQISSNGRAEGSEPTQFTTRTTATADVTQPRSAKGWRRWLVYPVLFLAIVFLGLSFWMEKGGSLSSLMSPSKEGSESIAGTPPKAAIPSKEVSAGTAPVNTRQGEGVDWPTLVKFRKTSDPKGPPFRIADQTLGQGRPFVVGVLSPLIQADTVKLAIFPDNEKNLMPVLKVWILSVPVLDGYFSAGPLNYEGEELPPGHYHLMVAARGKFLGQVAFDFGTWPQAEQLAQKKEGLQRERTLLAEKERSALELKYREIVAALEQLKQHAQTANRGPKGAADWSRLSSPWRSIMLKALEEQRFVMMGPMFYSEAQSKLYQFMFEILKAQEALDILSAKGPKGFRNEYKKGLGQMWSELAGLQSTLGGELQSLGQASVGAFQLDGNVIKQRLMSVGGEDK